MVDIPLPSARIEPVTQPRVSSSLLRVPDIWAVAVFGIACISLSFSGLLSFSTVAGRFAGVSLTGILTVAVLVSLVHAWTYASIGAAAPRSGADYVFAGRVLGGPLAFAASLVFVVFSALFAGSLLFQVSGVIIPMLLRTGGMALQDPAWLSLAVEAESPYGMMMIGTALGVIAFGLSILHPRTQVRILAGGLAAALTAWGILFFQLYTSSANAFPSTWDQLMGTASYGQRIALAQSLGMQTAPTTQTLVSGGLMAGFLVFFGYFASTFFAGEVKQPGKSLLAGSWISLLVTWGVFMAAAVIMQRLVPANWIAAESYLYQSGHTGAMPWIVFYAAILKPQAVLLLVVSVAWLFSFVNLIQAFFFYCSRVILAWSRDGLIPEGISYVHPQMRSPLVAGLIVAIIAELGLLVTVLTGLQDLLPQNFVFFVAASQLVPVTAAVLFPFRKRKWFEKSTGIVRLRILGVPMITITGVLSLLYLLAVIALSFQPGTGQNPVNASSPALLAGGFVVGIVWYYVRSKQLKQQGKNLSSAFTSLPPE